MPVISQEGLIDRGDSRTLTVSVTAGGALIDPGLLTLAIRTPAGVTTTYSYPEDPGIVRDSIGTYHFELVFSQAGSWTYQWQSTNPSQVQGETLYVSPTPLDVVPGTDTPYFTIGEARSFSGGALANAEKYSDSEIEAARIEVETELEGRCGCAFVPRTTTEVLDANGGTDILLRWPRPLTIVSVELNDAALTPADLAVYPDGRVYNASGWTRGRGNLTITYTHGYATVFPPAKRAALTWVKSLLIPSPMDDRATRATTDEMTYDLTTLPPRVTEFINTYNLNVAVA